MASLLIAVQVFFCSGHVRTSTRIAVCLLNAVVLWALCSLPPMESKLIYWLSDRDRVSGQV